MSPKVCKEFQQVQRLATEAATSKMFNDFKMFNEFRDMQRLTDYAMTSGMCDDFQNV